MASCLSWLALTIFLSTGVQSARYDNQAQWGGSCSASTSKKQSPIDIQDFKGACDNSIKLDLKLKDDTTAFQATIASKDDPGYMLGTFNDTVGYLYASDLSGNIFGYNLMEMRLHAPAEHNIESQGFAVELQLFFNLRTEFMPRTIKRAALSFLFKESDDKKIGIPLLTMMSNASTLENQTVTKFIRDVLPSPLSYFTYEGSDTAPDCSEDIIWYVVEKPIDISATQIDVFNKLYKSNTNFAGGRGNNRDIQDLNNRVIKKGGVECEEQFIYFFSFVLLYAFINYFIFKLL